MTKAFLTARLTQTYADLLPTDSRGCALLARDKVAGKNAAIASRVFLNGCQHKLMVLLNPVFRGCNLFDFIKFIDLTLFVTLPRSDPRRSKNSTDKPLFQHMELFIYLWMFPFFTLNFLQSFKLASKAFEPFTLCVHLSIIPFEQNRTL